MLFETSEIILELKSEIKSINYEAAHYNPVT